MKLRKCIRAQKTMSEFQKLDKETQDFIYIVGLSFCLFTGSSLLEKKYLTCF